MATFMESGATWLAGKLKEYSGRSVVYTAKAGTTFTVTGTRTSIDFEVVSNDGQTMTHFVGYDYLFTAVDLTDGVTTIVPVEGDRLVDDGETYEVMPLAGRPCYERADAWNITFTVHTKRIKT